jgi:hypothetical protein
MVVRVAIAIGFRILEIVGPFLQPRTGSHPAVNDMTGPTLSFEPRSQFRSLTFGLRRVRQ